jgi:hypothetical protein
MKAPVLAFVLLGFGCAAEVDTSTTSGDISVWQWADDVQIPNQFSVGHVGLAAFGGRVHQLHTIGSTGPLAWSIFNGETWSTEVELAQHADGVPAMTVFNNRIAAVYKPAGQNRLVMMMSDGHSWSTPVNAGTTIGTATLVTTPAVAVQAGVLYAAYCVRKSDGDHLRVDRFSTEWSMVTETDAYFSCRHVALAALPDGRLDLIANTEGASSWYMEETMRQPQGTTWSALKILPMKSKKPLSIVTCGNTTHLVHGGYSTPSEIWWTTRDDYGSWHDDVKVPNQASNGGATLGCFQTTRPIMVHNGGSGQLWWSEFLP